MLMSDSYTAFLDWTEIATGQAAQLIGSGAIPKNYSNDIYIYIYIYIWIECSLFNYTEISIACSELTYKMKIIYLWKYKSELDSITFVGRLFHSIILRKTVFMYMN